MHLIRHLSSNEENKLTVIEKKKERCKEVSNKFDATIINEDGSNPEIMKKAEASQADLMVVATDDDRVNIAATRNAKKEFGVPRVVSLANSPKNKERLKGGRRGHCHLPRGTGPKGFRERPRQRTFDYSDVSA